MEPRVSCGVRRCAIGAVVALGVAVLAPATAGAEAGPGATLPGTPTTVDLVAAIESAAGDGRVAAVVVDAVAGVVDMPRATTAEPASEEVGDEGTAESAAPPRAEEPPKPADTTAQKPDTTSDTPPKVTQPAPSPAPSPAAPAVAVQVSPSNVNVSVRVESPGENGPVNQLNLAQGVAAAAPSVVPAAPSGRTEQRPKDDESGLRGAAVSRPESAAIPVPNPAGSTWNWQWDCVSVPAFTTAFAGGSSTGITPNNWIWNWNCGENTTQYRGETTGQYLPINVNVGVRISSPGNDGPVTQTNVVVAIGAGTAPMVANPPPAQAETPVGVPAPEEHRVAGTPEQGASPPGEVAPVVAAIETVVLQPTDDHVEPSHGSLRWSGVVARVLEPAGFGPEASVRPGLRRTALSALPMAAIRPWTTRRALPSAVESQPRSTSGEAAATKAAPRWTRSRGIRGSITRQSSGTSVAPAGVGSSSGGGLPLVLALPFLVAVLDMARRLALDRVATPSGHRSRVPDDPG